MENNIPGSIYWLLDVTFFKY